MNIGSMKKGIIVLLIAVLAIGFAFADVTKFTGSAQVDYTFGLNEGDEFGFKNSQSTTFKFDFEFATADVDKAEHQTDFWAEIGASAWAGYKDSSYTCDVEITKANIHIKDLTINILGPKGPYNYAASWTINPSTKKPFFDYANSGFKYTSGGVELLYGGFSLSIAQYKSNAATGASATLSDDLYFILDEDWAEMSAAEKAKYQAVLVAAPGAYYAKKVKAVDPVPAQNEIYVGLQTKDFELAEGITATAAANGLIVGTQAGDEWNYAKKAGAALKFNYKTDKLGAGIALDADYGAKTFSLDALANAKFTFTENGTVEGKVYFGFQKAEDQDAKMALEAYAKAVIPAGDIKVTVEAEANRLLNVKPTDAQKEANMHFNANWAGYTLKASAVIDKFTVGAYANYNQVIDTQLTAKQYGMNAGADLTFKAEKFTVKAGAGVNFVDKMGDDLKYAITAYALKPTASISTTALVENCTLSLAWSGARILFDEDYVVGAFTKDNGKLTATAKIEF